MQFINKTIAVLGLGQEGIDLILWLTKNTSNCQIIVFDQKEKSELKENLDQIKSVKLAGYSFGKDCLKKDLTKFDIIFRSPGIHRLHPTLIKAGKQGVLISSPTKLFFDLCPAKIIGVTGTKGKGTTTTLIHRILKQSGKTSYIAANIGKPTLQLLSKLKPSDYVCLELSSFQLQDLTKSPHIAVALNITSEHLDIHKDTQEYRQAKQNIVAYQTKKDLAVINADYLVSKDFAKKTKAQIYYFSRKQSTNGCFVKHKQIILNINNKNQLIGDTDKLLLRGQHNWENITAAITAAKLAGASLSAIKNSVFTFKGLEHRLELVREISGKKFYNDSFSSTPETAIAAIQSFTEPTTIILGGSDKGSNYTQLGKVIVRAKNLATIILIGDMADQIRSAIDRAGVFKGTIIDKDVDTIEKIVTQAFNVTKAGGVIVLSPACASFDMFSNYKDRGNQFKKVVKSLNA